MSEIVKGSRVKVRADIETADIVWPKGCADRGHVAANLNEEQATVVLVEDFVTVDNFDGIPVALVIWDGNAEDYTDGDNDGMPTVYGWLIPVAALEVVNG